MACSGLALRPSSNLLRLILKTLQMCLRCVFHEITCVHTGVSFSSNREFFLLKGPSSTCSTVFNLQYSVYVFTRFQIILACICNARYCIDPTNSFKWLSFFSHDDCKNGEQRWKSDFLPIRFFVHPLHRFALFYFSFSMMLESQELQLVMSSIGLIMVRSNQIKGTRLCELRSVVFPSWSGQLQLESTPLACGFLVKKNMVCFERFLCFEIFEFSKIL